MQSAMCFFLTLDNEKIAKAFNEMCRNRSDVPEEDWAEDVVSDDGSLYSDAPNELAMYGGEVWIESMTRVRLRMYDSDDAGIDRLIVPRKFSELKKVFDFLDDGLGVPMFFEPGEIDNYFRDALTKLEKDTTYAKVRYVECNPYESGADSYEGFFEYDRAFERELFKEYSGPIDYDEFCDIDFDSEPLG